jgi:hypothetical protein
VGRTAILLSFDLIIFVIGGNILGIPLIFIMQYTLTLKPWSVPPFLPSSIFVIGNNCVVARTYHYLKWPSFTGLIGLVCLILVFYDGQYKRLACEQANHEGKSFLINPGTDAENNLVNCDNHNGDKYDANAPLLRDTNPNSRTRRSVDKISGQQTTNSGVNFANEGGVADMDPRVVRVGSFDNSASASANIGASSSTRPSESWGSSQNVSRCLSLSVIVCLIVPLLS